jgi:hypothetical protein
VSSTSSAQPLGVRGAERGAATRVWRSPTLWPLALYAVLSLALFGLPVIRHLGSRIVASDQIDSSQFMWFLAWWPHAILHGLNPFVTHEIFYPSGFNLEWSTSMPLEGIVLAPITLAFSPVVSWNVIQLVSPALSAWTAYLLCRHIVRKTGPALIGGYLFGFSPYMLVHLTGGPYLAMVAFVPLIVLLTLKLVEGSIGAKWFVVATALCLAGQYLTSTEVLASGTLFGGFALLAAFALLGDDRPALRRTAGLLAVAYVGAAVLVSPFLYYFFFGQHYPPGATGFKADLSSFVLPPRLVAVQLHAGPPYVGSNLEGYLSVPLVLLAADVAWRRRRSRPTLIVVLSALAAAVASLGGRLLVRGHATSIWLPWRLFRHLPVLRYAITVRFALFVILPVAMLAAIALADAPREARWRGVGRWLLAAAAIVFIAPAVGNVAWNIPVSDPPFFAHDTYKHYLRPDDHVLTVPVWGPNERWIADAGFPFALSAGYAGNPFPTSYTGFPTWNTLLTGRLTPSYAAQLRRFIAAKHVTAVVVQDGLLGPWQKLFGTLGVRPVSVGGVLVYRLSRRT